MAEYKTFTDNELLALLKKDDHVAFEEIFHRYNKLLFLYAFKKLQYREEAKDVIQDVFVWLWNNHDTFSPKTTLSGYLYKSVLNRVFDIFKHNDIMSTYIANGEHYINVNSLETDYLIREKDIAALIEQEIAGMPPRMQEIFILKRKEYLSTKDIAERLTLSEHTVSTQLKRALKHLRLRLASIMSFFI